MSWLSSCVLAQHSVTRTKNFSTLARAAPAPSTTRARPAASSTRTCPAPARIAVQVNTPRAGLVGYISHVYILVYFHVFVCSLLLRCMFEV